MKKVLLIYYDDKDDENDLVVQSLLEVIFNRNSGHLFIDYIEAFV